MLKAANDRVILGAILLLALALRVPCMNAPLWYDEITTVETHLKLNWREMLQAYSMNHHYLHNIAAKLSMDLLGEEPWAIRFPALLFGLAGIAAMWVLARDVAGRRAAHVTGLLLALSYHHIWFSTNARGYTGMALFSTLGLIWFLRGMAQPTRRAWLVFAACMAATIFTHLTGAFFFAALGLIWLTTLGARARHGILTRDLITLPFVGFLIGAVVSLAVYAPILPSLLNTVSTVSESSAIDPMKEYQNPLWAAYEGMRTGLGEAGPAPLLVGLLVLGLTLIGAASLRRRQPLFAPAVLAHIAITIAALLAVGMRIWPRFFFVDIAFLLLLIVLGVQACCTLTSRVLPQVLGRLALPVAVLAMTLVSGVLAFRNYSAPKQDLAGAVTRVEAERKPGERVYALSYLGDVFTGHFGTDWATIWTSDDYLAAMAIPGPLTIVVSFPARNFREYPAIESDRASGRLVEQAYLPGTLGDGAVILLHRD